MTAFYMNEAAFDLPDVGFVDKTVTYLEAPVQDDEAVALVIERAPLEKAQTLRDLAAAHVTEARTNLRAYDLMFEREREISGIPALDFGAKWRDDDGLVYTRHIHLIIGETAMVLASEGPFHHRELMDRYVEHVAASLAPRHVAGEA